jgi:hypothetical protein
MLRALPLVRDGLLVREWTRQDVDLLAGWPPYPIPYEGFAFSFVGESRYDFVRPHIRRRDGRIELCFWAMECRTR